MASTSVPAPADPRAAALTNYRKKLLEHREMETKVKDCKGYIQFFVVGNGRTV
jgi:26S proteasome regulatory subunit T4